MDRRPTPHTSATPALWRGDAVGILDAMGDGLVVFDAAGRTVMVNDAISDLIGVRRDELLEMDVAAFARLFELRDLHDHHVPVEQWPVSRILRGETLASVEYQVLRLDTPRSWTISFSGEMMRDPRDGRTLAVVVSRDVTARRAAEDLLRNTRDTFYALIHNNPFGIYVIDADFRVCEASLGTRRVFANVSPLIGRDFADVLRQIWQEPFATEAINRFRHTLRTGEPYVARDTVEQRHDIDALEAYDWRIERITLPDGRHGVVCYFYDLSERQQWERVLRDSEERFRLLADAMPQLVWTARPDGTVVYYNSQSSRYANLNPHSDRPDEWDWQPIVHPDDLAGTAAAWTQAVQSLQTYQYEHRIRMADGSFRWHLSRAYRPGEAPDALWYGTATDIHELKQAEAALRESEQRLRLALEASDTGFWTWDLESDSVLWSSEVANILGVDPSAFDGSAASFFKLIHPDDAARVQDTVRLSIAEDRLYECEFRVVADSGEVRWVANRGRAGRTAAGVRRMIGTVTDITARKHAEEQLRLHRDQLESLVLRRTAELEQSQNRVRLSERMASLGTLSAGIGHDMGNILLPMRIWLADLQASPLPDRAAHAVESLWRSVEYLRDLASGLRSLSLDPDNLSATPARTSLQTWWREVNGLYRAALPRGVSIAVSIEDVHPVAVPSHVLTQAVFNLVQNAADAMRARAAGTISIEAVNRPDAVQLIVRDNGPGMSPEVLQRCMDPFFTTKARGIGTGLGLSIVHGSLARFGASIDVQSEQGRGASFTILLPRAADRAPQKLTAAVSISDARLSAVVRSLLTGLGVEVGVAPAASLARIWIVDTSVPEAEVHRFASESDSRGTVVRLGAPPQEPPHAPPPSSSPGVLCVVEPKPSLLRDALRQAVRMAGTPR